VRRGGLPLHGKRGHICLFGDTSPIARLANSFSPCGQRLYDVSESPLSTPLTLGFLHRRHTVISAFGGRPDGSKRALQTASPAHEYGLQSGYDWNSNVIEVMGTPMDRQTRETGHGRLGGACGMRRGARPKVQAPQKPPPSPLRALVASQLPAKRTLPT
jgi:hypothetical protein